MQDHVIEPGPILSGTMRAEDILPAYLAELEAIAPATYGVRAMGTYAEEIKHAKDGTLGKYLEGSSDETRELHGTAYPVDTNIDRHQYVGECIEMIAEDINANIPEHLYFGADEHDPACHGYWTSDFWPMEERM